MASLFFKGRIDFEKLSMADISEVTAAVAQLQKLSEKEGFDFESGSSRRYAPRPDAEGKRSTKRPVQQRRLILALRKSGKILYVELEDATGMKMGSVNPHLSALHKEGLMTKHRDPHIGKSGRGRNAGTSYELTDEGNAVADELIADGMTLAT
ncbi:helix-turn-helix transcriptional regulator [Rhizobium sp. BK176]|uniref:helix-turn-helix transcriptional regulator n=1 Tax=Rhizobium sp. BK176 TaxID=2587071 RepID=UPI0021697D63|nr:helix-turn-helix transcriptional regulator [Rhizobium sp. BK176]MCS4088710.1 DNA-binding transcriptional ArsR family regulator [Rhizobium sp. BK176]